MGRRDRYFRARVLICPWRAGRSTALVDNTVGDFVYALRSFARAPLVSFTIVATVALGLAIVTVLFSILNVFRPVMFGLVAGGGLAAGLATLLVSMPAAATFAEIVHVLDPVACAASLLFIIVACLLAASVPAARASRVDPMHTLRQD